MSRSDPTPRRATTPDSRLPTADWFPDRAPLDHVPVLPSAERRLPIAALVLLGSIAVLGVAALAWCWPW